VSLALAYPLEHEAEHSKSEFVGSKIEKIAQWLVLQHFSVSPKVSNRENSAALALSITSANFSFILQVVSEISFGSFAINAMPKATSITGKRLAPNPCP
jgi:hypothetical protein